MCVCVCVCVADFCLWYVLICWTVVLFLIVICVLVTSVHFYCWHCNQCVVCLPVNFHVCFMYLHFYPLLQILSAIYCKRLGLFRLGISTHNNSNDGDDVKLLYYSPGETTTWRCRCRGTWFLTLAPCPRCSLVAGTVYSSPASTRPEDSNALENPVSFSGVPLTLSCLSGFCCSIMSFSFVVPVLVGVL